MTLVEAKAMPHASALEVQSEGVCE